MSKSGKHPWQIDLHRADILAGAAQGLPFAEIGMFVDAIQQWRDYSTNRTAVGRIIGMSANSPVNRADIETCSATDAGKYFAELRVCQDF